MNNLQNKTIWLSGASSGIGKCLAIELASAGNTVIVTARSDEELNKLAAQFPNNIISLPWDITEFDGQEDIARQISAHTDFLDVVIMAAGVAEYENDLSLPIDMYQKVFNVNLLGAINTLGVALPFLRKSEHKAQIVGISSLSSVVGFPRAEAYGTSKAALEYFLNSLRTDLNPRKFDISIIRPGFIKTPMTDKNDFPMPFLMEPEEAAKRIFKAVEKRKRVFAFPKRLSFILYSFSFMPFLWYRFIAPKLSRQ